MKVLIFTRFFPPEGGGIQTYSLELSKALHRLKEKILVIAPGWPGAEKIDKTLPFKVVRVKGGRIKFLRLLTMGFSLLSQAKKERPDFILHTTWAPGGFFQALFKVFIPTPFLVVVHYEEVFFFPQRKKLILFTFKRAKKLISVSEFTRRNLLRLGVPSSKIVVIPGGVDTGKFTPGVDTSRIKKKYGLENKKVLLTVSRLARRKGIDMVIETLPELLKKFPELVYVVVGEGKDKRRLKEIARRKGVKEKVIFAGFVPPEKLPLYYGACDLFVMPSREEKRGDAEGFGLSYLEAGASGKAVVGGNSGGIKEAIRDGITGILVEPFSKEDLKEGILKLLKNDKLREEMGKKGRERARKEFDWLVVGKKIKKVMEEIEIA